jgi:hypothetical protein
VIELGLIVLGATAMSVPIGAYVALRERLARRAAWVEAAHGAGLRDVEPETAWWSFHVLTAHSGPYRVHIEEFRNRSERGQRIVIDGDFGIGLRPEGMMTAVEKAVRAREIEIGDEEFDREVYMQGDPGRLRAALDVRTRRLVRDLLRGPIATPGGLVFVRVTVREGAVTAETGLKNQEVRVLFGGVLERLLDLARRLERPPDVPARLLENMADEREWGVRMASLRYLARDHPHHPATRRAMERALDDERQEVQLQAALGLDDETGRAMLLQIATREWSDDPVAARAVAALGGALPTDRVQTVLVRALRTRQEQTALACMATLGASGDLRAADLLTRVLRVESGALAEAAARALGGVGSTAAIAALVEAGGRDPALERAARQAVAEIRSRIDATPGQLTLAPDGEGGRVSLAGDGGQVSLPDDGPARVVSLAERRRNKAGSD